MTYRTFEEQRDHYFDRPRDRTTDGPVGGPSAWTASELTADDAWRFEVPPNLVEALDHLLDDFVTAGTDPGELTREVVDLGASGQVIDSWREMVEFGRGVALVRGFPVDRWGIDRTALATWCIGLHLGFPGAQNPQGDLLGHVRDDGEAGRDDNVRLYQTSRDIRFHCDYADVVGLMCLRQSQHGGDSLIASSTAVHDELWRIDESAVRRLQEPVWLDLRNEDSTPAVAVRPFAFDGDRMRVFYHSDYFRSADRHGGEYAVRDGLRAALDRFDAIAADPRFSVRMRLEPGDLQLLSNHAIVHARSAYEDDLESPRHLLRLWLSLTEERRMENR